MTGTVLRQLTVTDLGLIIDEDAVATLLAEAIRTHPDGASLNSRLHEVWAVVDTRGNVRLGVGRVQLVGVPFRELLVDLAVDMLRATN